jgi:hypothetical protein
MQLYHPVGFVYLYIPWGRWNTLATTHQNGFLWYRGSNDMVARMRVLIHTVPSLMLER